MFKLYCRAWPEANLAIFDITKDDNAKDRSSDYLVRHGYDPSNWTELSHWNLHTDDHSLAQEILRDVRRHVLKRYWARAQYAHLPAPGRAREIMQVRTNEIRLKLYNALRDMGFYQRDPQMTRVGQRRYY
jgi:hypothetical protein